MKWNWSSPSGAAIAKIKGFGAKLMCFAPTAALAKKLVRSGVDAIIIEGSEKARDTARDTLQDVRQAMGLDYR